MQSTRTSFRLPFALAVGVASAVALAGCSTADEPSPTIGADDLAELLPTLDEVVAATDVDGAAGTWTLARSSSDAGTSSPSGVSADGGPADGDLGLCAMDFRSLTSDRSLPSATAVFTRDRQQFTTGVVSRDDADAYVDALRDELEGCPATTTAGVSGQESTFTLTPFEGRLVESGDSSAVCFTYAASFGGAPARGHACQVAQDDLVTLSWVASPTDREGLEADDFARLVDVATVAAAV